MKTHKLLPIGLLMALLTGCAFTPQEANLDPTISVMPSQEGQGVTVSVNVVDERPSKSLGHRGTGYGKGAEITASQDLDVVVYNKIVSALETKGFTVTEAGVTAPVDLKIELRLLEYSTSVGFWTGGVHVNGAMKAVATNNGDVYERMYRSDDEERVVFVPDASSNEKMINESLSFLLNQVIGDNALIGHLAK
jgi:uncharacterized lipoprotein YajG